MYTESAIYFGVVLLDRDPSGLTTSDSRRDSPLDDTDSFRIVLDTYRDRQNGSSSRRRRRGSSTTAS